LGWGWKYPKGHLFEPRAIKKATKALKDPETRFIWIGSPPALHNAGSNKAAIAPLFGEGFDGKAMEKT